MNAAEAAAGALWFALYAAAVLAGIRGMPQRSPAVIAVGSAILLTAAAFPMATLAPIAGNFWRDLAVFCFLAICYLMIFGAVYKSVSLRMMLDLLRAPAQRMSAEELFRRSINSESFQARIQVMIAQGLATQSAAGFALTPKGRGIARGTRMLQCLFGIQTSG